MPLHKGIQLAGLECDPTDSKGDCFFGAHVSRTILPDNNGIVHQFWADTCILTDLAPAVWWKRCKLPAGSNSTQTIQIHDWPSALLMTQVN
jgi:hypothetical protein